MRAGIISRAGERFSLDSNGRRNRRRWLRNRCAATEISRANAFRTFPMAGTGVHVCLEALLRSDVTNSAASLFIQKPMLPLPNHPE